MVIAVVVGVVVGVVNVKVRALLDDTVLNAAISFVVPFVAYVPAEEFDASGVLAVVVTGLVTGHLAPRLLRAQDRLGEEMNWRTLAFLLESAIFLLMGLSLKTLIDEAHTHANGMGAWRAFLYGLALAGFVIVVRMVFVAPLVAMVRRDERKAAAAKPFMEGWQKRLATFDFADRFGTRKKERIERRVARVGADIEFRLTETFGWRGGVVLAWSGMRGAITVAAAQTLPEDTPYRPQLILMAFVVAAATLLLQGLSLPAVIRTLKVPGDDPARLRKECVELVARLSNAASDVLDEKAMRDDIDPQIVSQVREDSLIRPIRPGDEQQPRPTPEAHQVYLRLRLAVMAAEHTALLQARADGTFSARALNDTQHILDLEEARLQHVSDRTGGDQE
ncbi:cation:proton antiporter [Streptomyces sp. NPDC093065]|uniref:cation:proton antiporter domain-containing protein n=1 Tax=Streptomyces sp. NPDC093065 TaxID=3366021 RepID=UPI00381AAED1